MKLIHPINSYGSIENKSIMSLINEFNKIVVIRGATTCQGNSKDHVKDSVQELINELILRNELIPNNILSITFTVTNDINCCFPASIARTCNGLDTVAFLDCQQMYVPNDISFCIRLMALTFLKKGLKPNHPYLRGASKLRPDRC